VSPMSWMTSASAVREPRGLRFAKGHRMSPGQHPGLYLERFRPELVAVKWVDRRLPTEEHGGPVDANEASGRAPNDVGDEAHRRRDWPRTSLARAKTRAAYYSITIIVNSGEHLD
jgi:hypothetical protein